MTKLRFTKADVARWSRRWVELVEKAGRGRPGAMDGRRVTPLRQVHEFGSNPGALDMLTYVPPRLQPSPGLVVVLHGCTQNAAGYNEGAGWSTLADRYGFVVVFPQQRPANSHHLCFNWFQPEDVRREQGEALSIRQMVEHAIKEHGVDRSRVFIGGLSAGGAMTAAMLAAYPDVFAGGAVLAGLPYGVAGSLGEALAAMFQGRTHSPREWGDLVRAASPHHGPWPKLSVWHGEADKIVRHENASELLKQWTDVHGVPVQPSYYDVVDGHSREVWRNALGDDVIEFFSIPGMGHGTPLAVGAGDDQGGIAGAHMLDIGISSTYHTAKFWGLTANPLPRAEGEASRPATRPTSEAREGVNPARDPGRRHEPAAGVPPFVAGTVLDTLRSAGVNAGVLDIVEGAFKVAGLVR